MKNCNQVDRLNAYMFRDVSLLLLPMFGTSSTAQAQMGAPCQVHRKIGWLPPTEYLVGERRLLPGHRSAGTARSWPSCPGSFSRTNGTPFYAHLL